MSALRRSHVAFMLVTLPILLFINACEQEPAPPPEQATKPEPVTTVVVSPEERIEKVKAELEEIKMAVANEGDYLCCIKPACDWCLLHEGNRKCRENLDAKKEVCAGCGLGWHNGQGVVEGVKASDVKWNIVHSHKEESGGHAH